MIKKIPLTKEKVKELELELDHLISIERPEVIKAVKEARELGDLSENSEYTSAKEKQGIVEGRILDIKELLNNYEIIAETDNNTVSIGKTVVVFDEDLREEVTYQIVSSFEANPVENKISDTNPLAKAILGKKVGDKVEVQAPNFSYTVSIISIK